MMWVDRFANLGRASECCLFFICFVELLMNRSEGKTSFQSEKLSSAQMALARTVGIRLLLASLELEGHTTLFFTAVLYPIILPCYRAVFKPMQEVSKLFGALSRRTQTDLPF